MAATTLRKGLRRKHQEKIADKEKKDVEIMKQNRRKQPKKVTNREEIGKRTATVSESSSDSNFDFLKCNSPPQKISNTAQPSCSCKEEINSLKNYIKETIEKNCKPISIQLNQLGSRMVDMQATLNELLERPTDISTSTCDVVSGFKEIWKLPCQTVEEFEEFDERIGKEMHFRKKLAQKLISIINKRTTIARNTGEILRFCLSREVALKCNAVKHVEGKLFVFRDTNLYNVVKAAMLSALSTDENPLKDCDIIKVIGTVLHHCRDWEGGRVKRQKKTIPNTNENTHRLSEINQSQDLDLDCNL